MTTIKNTDTNEIVEVGMIGTDKQRAYAISLAERIIAEKNELAERQNGSAMRLTNKNRETCTAEKLSKRESRINDYLNSAFEASEIARVLGDALVSDSVHAGDIIDCCQGRWFDMVATRPGLVTVGFKKYKTSICKDK